jgi:fused signal recognition particle receptor
VASVFDKLRNGLAKTRAGFVGEFSRLVLGRSRIDDELFDEVEELLIAADIGVDTSLKLIEELREEVRRQGVSDPKELYGILEALIAERLGERVNGQSTVGDDFFEPAVKPFVIMVVGVNGTGKTTSIGKLGYRFRQHGKRVLLAAADTFRAAAADQLAIWSKRIGADIVRTQPGGDPASVAFDALQASRARDIDVLIVDTAGRLHTKVNLMAELQKIHRVLGKGMEGAPHEVLLVLDASTGQNGLSQARQFSEAVAVSGIIVAKLDGTAKGGIVLAIQDELKVPVKFVGIGEGLEDLEPFDPKAYAEALFE